MEKRIIECQLDLKDDMDEKQLKGYLKYFIITTIIKVENLSIYGYNGPNRLQSAAIGTDGRRRSLGSILEKYDDKVMPDLENLDIKFDVKHKRPSSIEAFFQKKNDAHFNLARDEIFED